MYFFLPFPKLKLIKIIYFLNKNNISVQANLETKLVMSKKSNMSRLTNLFIRNCLILKSWTLELFFELEILLYTFFYD